MVERDSGVAEFSVSVGRLADLAATGGDINLRFTRRGSAQEGIRGHQRVRRLRPPGYRSEVALAGSVHAGWCVLNVRGRADGIYSSGGEMTVEEIKTIRVRVEEIPQSVQDAHWAQVRVYGHLFALEEGHSRVALQLCYLDLDSDETTEIREVWTAEELATFFEALTRTYLDWIARRSRWRAERDQSIATLPFPYPQYRPGQREAAVAAYRTMAGEEQLLIEAPTGLGKTLAVLYPAIKGAGEGVHQQVFYLTAKTSGREIAERSLATLTGQGLRLKRVTITAKEKICFSPGMACEPEQCSFARGYYDRLPEALRELLVRHDHFDRATVEAEARRLHLCPFELTLDLATWMDCIICDYNYVFDPAVYLRRFFDEGPGEYCFLVDEAHNLVDRGREMYSATLHKSELLAVRRAVKEMMPEVAKALGAMNRAMLDLRREGEDLSGEAESHVLEEVPARLVRAARDFCRKAEARLAEESGGAPGEALLQLYFDALAFVRISEYFGPGYVTLLQGVGGGHRWMRVTLYCMDPSEHLGRGFAYAASSVLFSATLTPAEYYRNLLGIAEEARVLRCASPFPGEHLGVFVAHRVSTTYRNRAGSYDQVVAMVRELVDARTGNYLIYFPSYRYMEEVARRYREARPDATVVLQERGMSEPDRDAFLAGFVADPAETVVGFAVMGGVFGEGIDLAGTRLIGVMIVSVGLPQVGIERDLIMDYFTDSGMGFEFAYQYPGMTRVLQTAGRVIRGEEDRGVICLVDERYGQQRYRDLMPSAWRPGYVASSSELAQALAQFWEGVE